jgi:hypothetical protein
VTLVNFGQMFAGLRKELVVAAVLERTTASAMAFDAINGLPIRWYEPTRSLDTIMGQVQVGRRVAPSLCLILI